MSKSGSRRARSRTSASRSSTDNSRLPGGNVGEPLSLREKMMNDTPFTPLWAGVRPKLGMMKDHHAGLVYMYLLTRLDGRTGQCNPATPTIAADLGITE